VNAFFKSVIDKYARSGKEPPVSIRERCTMPSGEEEESWPFTSTAVRITSLWPVYAQL